MDWTQTLTIIGVNIALIAAMSTLIMWSISKIDSDVKGISSRMDSHATRIDQLYRMFVDLQSEIKDIYKDWNKEKK